MTKKPKKVQPETFTVPKLGEDTKAMNGKSGRKLLRCIRDLHCALDDSEPQSSEDGTSATE